MSLTLPSVELQDLTYTARQLGGDITITYKNTGTAGSEHVHVSDARVITVQIASGVSTAAQIKTAVEAHDRANELVSIEVTGTGSNAQLSAVEAPLAGGSAAVAASKAFGAILITADATGTGGNSIRVKFEDGEADVSVATNDITVTFPDGSLASTVITLINANEDAAALVTATNNGSVLPVSVDLAPDFVALEGGAAAVAASVILQDLTISSDTATDLHNGAKITYVDDGTAGSETVVVTGSGSTAVITAHIESGVSTATQVNAALNAAAAFTGAKATGVVTVADYTLAGALAASGTVTVVDYTQLTGAVLTVNSVALTEGVEWDAETDNDTTAANLEAAIEAVTDIDASVAGAIITVTAATAGAAGNTIPLATSDVVNLTISGALLADGRDATTVTVGASELVANVDWTAETSNNVTADNLAAAIDGLAAVVAPNPAAAIITVTAASPGTAGNSIALLTSNSDAVSVGAATLLGGTDAFASTVSGTGATAQLTVNAAPVNEGAVGLGPDAFYQDQAVALTSAFVPFTWNFPARLFSITNDETSGAKQVIISWDGLTTHFVLNFGETLSLDSGNKRGVFLKYGSAAPAYRLQVVG